MRVDKVLSLHQHIPVMSANIIQLFLGAARKGDIGTVRSLYESGQIVDIDGDDPLARVSGVI